MPLIIRPIRALLLSLLVLMATHAAAQEDPAASAPAAESPATRLLEILQDDEARAALIAELEQAARAADASEGEESSADVVTPATPEPSLGRRIALVTQGAAEGVVAWLDSTWQSVMQTRQIFRSLGQDEVDVILDALRELFLIIGITVAAFVTLRSIMIPVFRRMGGRARSLPLIPTVLLFSGSVLLDALIVLATWAIGYAVTLLAIGEFGQIGIRQTMYLNAFLVVELTKVVVRAVLAPAASGLRPVPISDAGALSLYRNTNFVVSVLGYGQLLVVPVINVNASFLAGRAISALILLVVLVHLVVLVLRRKRAVSDWMIGRMTPPELIPDGDSAAPEPPRRDGRRAQGLHALARNWHWFAFAYLAAMLLIVLTRPAQAVYAAAFASVQVLFALIVASVLSTLITRAVARGVALPDHVNSRLPLLERRLNGFVPYALLAIRLVIVVAFFFLALDVLGVLPVSDWLASELGLRFTGATASVVLILLLAMLTWLVMTSWIDYRLNPDFGSVPTAREETLLSLLRNAATIAILIITLMFCLAEIGLNIGPLLASAGVLGLAIGFGAQKMVQDIITGVFIQFENAINVGDVITVGGITGVVEKLTVRSVSLRDVSGVFHIIPFSSVDLVSNFTRDFSYFVADMGVAYREDTQEARQAMADAFDELVRDPDQGPLIIGEFEWFGLNSFGASEVVLRGRIKTLPGKQWGVGRAYNEIVKRIFDERGIEIPFPHQTIYFGERKDGTTQKLRVG
ncbi:mechanosensitive ion channel domain-containing protein [Histidinibacterium lentulum]|uniref:Mechanosensitive ion channel protein MscS n=1 Tax=Histidinibacterium lentulum TaxID=2480588 RepID=A0A3N2QRI9_9RHOB|nr:mechanosensitive ion channel domain-containing protein [Histidinibacterium lentulum]ROT97822.1 mechanosensitive ion channel protein MscS [Histidinibacterium lentulum]